MFRPAQKRRRLSAKVRSRCSAMRERVKEIVIFSTSSRSIFSLASANRELTTDVKWNNGRQEDLLLSPGKKYVLVIVLLLFNKSLFK